MHKYILQHKNNWQSSKLLVFAIRQFYKPKFIAFCCFFAFFSSNFFIENDQNQTEKANLGHFLFFDKHLSYNGTKSCASCHAPEFAFTDGYRRSIGAAGDLQAHNAPSLLNIAEYTSFHWADTSVKSINAQVKTPLFAEKNKELGLNEKDTSVLIYFAKNKKYNALFQAAFPQKNPYNFPNIIEALAVYVKSLKSENSRYDFYKKGDSSLLNNQEKLGETLFFQTLNCGTCHPYPSFTIATISVNAHANIGLYKKYPANDQGLFYYTKKAKDKGKFRIPSLRNVALTAPYMHDGSIRELDEVIDVFTKGGRAISYGKNAGNGSENKQKSKLIAPFSLKTTEKQALIAFLHTLTDTSYFHNTHFQNPF